MCQLSIKLHYFSLQEKKTNLLTKSISWWQIDLTILFGSCHLNVSFASIGFFHLSCDHNDSLFEVI